MAKELFSVNIDTKKVKALGVETTAKIDKVRIVVNEVDITESLSLNSLKIIESD